MKVLRKKDFKDFSCKEDKDISSEAGDIEIAGHGLANVGFQYNEILKRITKRLQPQKESMDKKGGVQIPRFVPIRETQCKIDCQESGFVCNRCETQVTVNCSSRMRVEIIWIIKPFFTLPLLCNLSPDPPLIDLGGQVLWPTSKMLNFFPFCRNTYQVMRIKGIFND